MVRPMRSVDSRQLRYDLAIIAKHVTRFAAALVCLIAGIATAQTPVSIQVDLNKTLGTYKPIYSWFGYDESNYTTMKDGKVLLSKLHDLSPVPVYIRAHHLFTSGNGVAELKWSSTNIYTLGADGKPVYDFAIIDQIFDTYKAAGVRPMIELGFMPKDLASGNDPYHVHFPGRTTSGSVQSPPKNYAEWGALCRKFAEHLISRYGREEVSRWYWEVWNEPDIDYWHGTQAEYNTLYDYAVSGVREALPTAIVGGPATTGPGAEHAAAFLRAFLQHVATDKSAANGKPVPLDFISFHVKGQPTVEAGQHVRMGLDKELLDADTGFAIVSSYPQFIRLPIILSEADPEGCAACSSRMNPSNSYRNGTLYPVYTAAAIKGLFELQDRRGVNLISMLSWSFEFEGRDYFEGFRSLSTKGIDKPILNLFRMAGMMSGERVATQSTGQVSLDAMLARGVRQSPDVDAFATLGTRQCAILLWHYHDDDIPAAPADLNLTVRGIPAGVYRALLQHYRIDDTHSNAYTAWKAMGSPQHPTPDQYAALSASAQLQLLTSPVWLEVVDGTVTLPATLPRQATSLIVLSW
jgi:xylan 1,4-beta-xylosidase